MTDLATVVDNGRWRTITSDTLPNATRHASVIGSVRLTKRQWYAMGGCSHSHTWRRQARGSWQYFVTL